MNYDVDDNVLVISKQFWFQNLCMSASILHTHTHTHTNVDVWRFLRMNYDVDDIVLVTSK